MGFRTGFIFILIHLSVSSGLACTTKMLDKKRIGPIRNQYDTGICYAFTAADLFSYKTGKQVSASGVAATYYISSKVSLKNNAYGGEVTKAMKLAAKAGLCLESEMTSTNPNLVFDSVKEMVDNKDNACENVEDDLAKIFPKANISALLKATSAYTDHYNKTMASLIINGCKNWFRYNGKIKEIAYTKRTNVFVDSFYGYKNSYDPLKDIDAQLDRGNLVGISVPDFNKFARISGNGGHSVSIVGRKKNPKTNQCMYQMRNSWGKSCQSYHKRFRDNCKDGYVWVNGDDLYNPKTYELNVRRVIYLEK